MQTQFHPAPGLGDLLNGWFIVPQNPIRDESSVLVPSVMAQMPNQVLKVKAMGDLMAGSFVLPQNSVAVNTGLAAAPGGCGLGCGCAGSNYGLSGLDMTSVTDWLTAPSMVSAVPNWLLWSGGALAAYMLMAPGGKEYRTKSRALRSEYRGYKRASRRLSEATAV